MKLIDSKVKRGGATADYLSFETSDISFNAESWPGAHFYFGISSKGGGTTMISLEISDTDLPVILREVLENRPKLAPFYIDPAVRAIELEKLNVERQKASIVARIDSASPAFEKKYGNEEFSSVDGKSIVRKLPASLKDIVPTKGQS
jgi:hypothetical protein